MPTSASGKPQKGAVVVATSAPEEPDSSEDDLRALQAVLGQVAAVVAHIVVPPSGESVPMMAAPRARNESPLARTAAESPAAKSKSVASDEAAPVAAMSGNTAAATTSTAALSQATANGAAVQAPLAPARTPASPAQLTAPASPVRATAPLSSARVTLPAGPMQVTATASSGQAPALATPLQSTAGSAQVVASGSPVQVTANGAPVQATASATATSVQLHGSAAPMQPTALGAAAQMTGSAAPAQARLTAAPAQASASATPAQATVAGAPVSANAESAPATAPTAGAQAAEVSAAPTERTAPGQATATGAPAPAEPTGAAQPPAAAPAKSPLSPAAPGLLATGLQSPADEGLPMSAALPPTNQTQAVPGAPGTTAARDLRSIGTPRMQFDDRIQGFTRGALGGPGLAAYVGRAQSSADAQTQSGGSSNHAELLDEEADHETKIDASSSLNVIAMTLSDPTVNAQLAQVPVESPRMNVPMQQPAAPMSSPAAPLAQVEFAARAEGSQNEAASISIHHPDLGSIQLEVRRDHGRVEVHAVAESVHAEAVLRANESGIRRGVQQSGMAFSALRVRVRGEEQTTARPTPARRRKTNERE